MTAKKEAELKVLLSKREHVFASAKVVFDMAKGVSANTTSISSFLLRVKHLEKMKEDFHELTDRINLLYVSLNPEEKVDLQRLMAFDDLYYAILEVAECLKSNVVSSSASEDKVNLRLPKIDLPKFDGQVENWPSFIDIYLPLIHENKALSDTEKFHYLVSSLSGSALSMAKNVPLTASNYMVVFKALRERFDNKRILATAYLDKIFKLKPMSSSSLVELSRTTNILTESVNALNGLKIDNLSEFVLFYIASRSLNSETKQKFEEQNSSVNQLPTCGQLLKYLQNYLQILEVSKPCQDHISQRQSNNAVFRSGPSSGNSSNHNVKRSFVVSNIDEKSSSSKHSQSCPCCNQQHSIYKCTQFASMDVASRRGLVTKLKLCFNCLRSSHTVASCYSKTSCLTCGRRHNTLLHFEESTQAAIASTSSDSGNSSESVVKQPVTLACVETPVNHQIQSGRTVKLLGSALIRLRDVHGHTHMARALLDSCSHDCIMTTACAKRIGLPVKHVINSLAGIGAKVVEEIQGVTSCSVLPRHGDEPKFNLDFTVIPTITTDMPALTLPNDFRQYYEHLDLADPSFDKSDKIDVLLGVDIFDKLYNGQRFDPGPGFPVALQSIYGWVVTGRFTDVTVQERNHSTLLVSQRLNLEDMMQRFWAVEEPPCKSIPQPEEEICEAIYDKKTYREADGRYVVPIMAIEEESLGDSYRRSLNRFMNLEKRLVREPELKNDYVKFMDEYEGLGHMQPFGPHNSTSFIIPHHCVIRPSSVTTKLRVVFDASCKTSNGKSLNDIVYSGPKLQMDVIDIITKFRLHAIVFTADICKMYRQIKIIPEDRHYQHILWRESLDKPIREYELNTVTYGVSSSPYLAIRTLRQLAKDHGEQFPRAAEVVCEETFMDDITTGAGSLEDAIKLRDDVISFLKLGQFELRKWSSNELKILEDIPSEYCQSPKSFEETDVFLKILGIKWDPNADHFSYSCSDADMTPTKRKVLSVIARIYDPLGWIAPVVLTAKLLMQELWKLHISWDEFIPDQLKKQWLDFATQLKDLKSLQLPRQVLPAATYQSHLVGFCDGSSKGYGCCVYLVAHQDAHSQVSLLIGKSKVAPLKTLTVNKLELCGAVLLAKVLKHMHDLLKDKIKIDSVIAFSDSTTALAWIHTEPCKLKTFIANRVVLIQESLDVASWRHVSTEDNPADCCSRGISVADLVNHALWWHGPAWLCSPSSEWPKQFKRLREILPEMKADEEKKLSMLVNVQDQDFMTKFIQRFSSFSKLQRTLACILRFLGNLRLNNRERKTSSLSVKELESARLLIIKEVQSTNLKEVFTNVRKGVPCVKSIQKLRPFIDSSGLLRVGGRLSHSDLVETAKHPILIPKCHLANLIIEYYHRTHLHVGPRTLQSLVVRTYWIIGIRLQIRSRLAKCVTCFKACPIAPSPLMGDLPSVRIQPSKCFESVGIDFGGPFMIKESKRRNARTYKVYVCLFVCLAVKAIHLEAVTELSTEAFIAALDRFIARRGLCKQIITDCGTNSVGAKRYLNEMFDLVHSNHLDITNSLTSREISWKLNPPGAPHFGGIFESGIRSTKYHLKRVVGSQTLTLEEIITVFHKVEAMLNSRPLCALSSSPSECDVLTPGHFLIGRPLVSLPERSFEDQAMLPHTRWQLLQKLTQSFWRTWQRDYLHTLQQRQKWSVPNPNLNVDDLVLINEPNLPTMQWKLGRVTETYPGQDNVTRVASVRTSTGILKRPVVKLCRLPIN